MPGVLMLLLLVEVAVQHSLKLSPDLSPQLPDMHKSTVRYNIFTGSWVCHVVSVQWDMHVTALVGTNHGLSL